jgi:hypothetical protein
LGGRVPSSTVFEQRPLKDFRDAPTVPVQCAVS